MKDFGTASLEIEWPKQIAGKKQWLLYLMKISSTGVDQIECTPKEEIDSLKMVSEKTSTQHIKVWWYLCLQV